MLRNIIARLIGDAKEKQLKMYAKKVATVRELEKKYADEPLEKIRTDFLALREVHKNEEEKIKALGLVCAAAHKLCGKKWEVAGHEKQWDMKPFDVQIIGALALLDGMISEMKTGEGKTLVAAMALSVAALSGTGAHLITANDYLAKRDSQWMSGLYEALGLSCAVIHRSMSVEEKKEAYGCCITYGTTTEFGFDYLRDNMAPQKKIQVQRGQAFAIVDEVDSILIDEARTPLIISAPKEESISEYSAYASLVKRLTPKEDFSLDEKQRSVTLTQKGIEKVESLLGQKNLFTPEGFETVHHIEQALKAEAAFNVNTDYVVQNGEVILVDEFTGRMMPGRRLSDGLHQALEAKEGVAIQKESRTLATITIQNFFRLYRRLSGMTGTAETESAEFASIYGLKVLPIPTHKKIARVDMPDSVYKNAEAKSVAVIEEIKKRNAAGQPLLIGTTTIEKSEELSRRLVKEGIAHEVLNAKQHEKEASIVEKAGQKGAVTIATNMAGRGTDISLGEGVVELGGLAIIGTERHESRRIDNQLRGRSGRQGDPGVSKFFVAMDDTLMRLFGGKHMEALMHTLRIPDHLPIENGVISSSIERAQKKIEGHHFDMRKHLVQFDDVMNEHRKIVYSRRQRVLEEERLSFLIKKELQEVIDIEDMQLELARALSLSENITAGGLSVAFESHMAMIEKKGGQEYIRALLLRAIDSLWMYHLDDMKYLRENVSLRGYGQRDPLNEYKQEAYVLFEQLMQAIQRRSVLLIAATKEVNKEKQVLEEKKLPEKMPSRNEPCFCGSGKKYKKCCGTT